MKKVLILDSYCNVDTSGLPIGHYVKFFKGMSSVLERSFNVTIACSEIYQKYLTDAKTIKINTYPLKAKSNMVTKIKSYLSEIKIIKLLLNHNFDIFIMQGERFTAQLLALIFLNQTKLANKKIYIVAYSSILISEKSVKGLLRQALYYLAKQKLSGIITGIDKLEKIYGLKALVIPDYFNQKIIKTSMDNKYDIALLGIINYIKDVEIVVNSFNNTKYRVLIAGKFSSDERYHKIINMGLGKNIEIYNKYLTEDKYLYFLTNSKYIILPYKSEEIRSSGIFYEALFNLKPLIVSNYSFFEKVKELDIGYQYIDTPRELFDRLDDDNHYNIMRKRIFEYITSCQKDVNKRIIEFFK